MGSLVEESQLLHSFLPPEGSQEEGEDGDDFDESHVEPTLPPLVDDAHFDWRASARWNFAQHQWWLWYTDKETEAAFLSSGPMHVQDTRNAVGLFAAALVWATGFFFMYLPAIL